MKGAVLIAAGVLLILWLATNISDPAPAAKNLLLLGVLLVLAGVWVIVRGR